MPLKLWHSYSFFLGMTIYRNGLQWTATDYSGLQRTTVDHNGLQQIVTDHNGPQRTAADRNGPRWVTVKEGCGPL